MSSSKEDLDEVDAQIMASIPRCVGACRRFQIWYDLYKPLVLASQNKDEGGEDLVWLPPMDGALEHYI